MNRKKPVIMVVDDELGVRESLKMLLEDDYEVSDYSDPVHAIESIDEVLPELILLDITMPGMNGLEFLKKLRLRENEIALIDMEAGVEHFGRGVDVSIDAILIAVEPSYESMAIARRIKEISSGMGKPFWAVLNKVKSNAVATKLKTDLKKSSIEVIGVIPDDPLIFEASFEGRPFMAGAATRAARGILDFLLSLE